MSGTDQHLGSVIKFPLVGPHTPLLTAFIAIVRRLSVARSLPELMEIVTHAARTLLGADGITFVLREGDLCYYAEEELNISTLEGSSFPHERLHFRLVHDRAKIGGHPGHLWRPSYSSPCIQAHLRAKPADGASSAGRSYCGNGSLLGEHARDQRFGSGLASMRRERISACNDRC